MLQYEVLTLGDLSTNCYVLWDEESKEAFVIDPADDGEFISDFVINKNLSLKGILATHGHFDHVMGALAIKLILDAPFYCSSNDQFLLERQKETAEFFLHRKIEVPNFKKIDIDLDSTETLKLGKSLVKVIKTPGHTPGGVSFYCPNEEYLFTGDTLFPSGVGRTDLSYSSPLKLSDSLKRLRELGENVIILAGH